MLILTSFIVFIFGVIVGSFLNVVVLRYNTGLSIVKGGSKCFSCGKYLSWYELFPLFSFIFQKGKCRKCKSGISWQYPLVEFLTGLMFLIVFWKINGISPFFDLSALLNCIFFIAIFSILIVITVYDLKHKIIPDGMVFTFIFLSLAKVLYFIAATWGEQMFKFYFVVLLSGPIVALPFFFLWFVSKGRWMGFGDVKLALGIGWLMGLAGGLSSIILAFEIGAVASLILLAIGRILTTRTVNKLSLPLSVKKLTIKSEIPFAPFLVLGTILIFIFEWDFMSINLFLRSFGL